MSFGVQGAVFLFLQVSVTVRRCRVPGSGGVGKYGGVCEDGSSTFSGCDGGRGWVGILRTVA